jgi:hypothetical protein
MLIEGCVPNNEVQGLSINIIHQKSVCNRLREQIILMKRCRFNHCRLLHR